ncbi:MAG: D-erythronate dehydrogenase [Betaproteobacteria bacterium]
MKVVITGGAGFLGSRLAQALLARGQLTGKSGRPEEIDELVLLDTSPTNVADNRVRSIVGDIADAAVICDAIGDDTHSIFHLAAIVSGQAEADFPLGMRINLDATRALLEACHALPASPRFVFASSVAVFGGALPEVVPEHFELNPQTSYGMQKTIGELLVNDFGRRGFVDARAYRLPTICVRPGKPNRAASSFASGIIREPLSGQDAECPVAPETRMWLSSPQTAIVNLIHGHEIDGNALGFNRALSLPGLSVSVAEMIDALRSVAGEAVASRIHFRRDETIERLVASWPGALNTDRACALGFMGDVDFREIVRAHRADSKGSTG